MDHIVALDEHGDPWDVQGDHDPVGMTEGHLPLHDVDGDAEVVIEVLDEWTRQDMLDDWYASTSPAMAAWARKVARQLSDR